MEWIKFKYKKPKNQQLIIYCSYKALNCWDKIMDQACDLFFLAVYDEHEIVFPFGSNEIYDIDSEKDFWMPLPDKPKD